jgi:hypothetical protein
LIGVLFLVLLVFYAFYIQIIQNFPKSNNSNNFTANEIGDMFGVLNSIFSALTLAGFIYTLKLQVDSQRAMTKQLKIMEKENTIEYLSKYLNMIDLYKKSEDKYSSSFQLSSQNQPEKNRIAAKLLIMHIENAFEAQINWNAFYPNIKEKTHDRSENTIKLIFENYHTGFKFLLANNSFPKPSILIISNVKSENKFNADYDFDNHCYSEIDKTVEVRFGEPEKTIFGLEFIQPKVDFNYDYIIQLLFYPQFKYIFRIRFNNSLKILFEFIQIEPKG